MQVEKHDGSRWNKTNTQEIKISLYSPEPDPRRRQDRLPGAAMLTGSPLPELLPRGLVEQGRPALETLRLPFATSVVGVWRSAFAFVLAGGFRFLSQKIVRLAFLITHRFSFLFLLGSVAAEVRGRGSGVSGHIRYSGPEKICVSAVILSVNFFTVHSTGPKCIGSIGDRRGRGREAKSGRPGAFSPGAPLISSLSLSLSLTHH